MSCTSYAFSQSSTQCSFDTNIIKQSQCNENEKILLEINLIAMAVELKKGLH